MCLYVFMFSVSALLGRHVLNVRLGMHVFSSIPHAGIVFGVDSLACVH